MAKLTREQIIEKLRVRTATAKAKQETAVAKLKKLGEEFKRSLKDLFLFVKDQRQVKTLLKLDAKAAGFRLIFLEHAPDVSKGFSNSYRIKVGAEHPNDNGAAIFHIDLYMNDTSTKTIYALIY